MGLYTQRKESIEVRGPERNDFIKLPKSIHLDVSVYRIPGYVYHFTIRADFGKFYFTHHNFNTEIIECLKKEKHRKNCNVYVYCLMPDHLHVLTGTTSDRVSVLDFVNQFKGKTTRIGWKYGIDGVLWQKRYYDHVVRKSEDLIKIASYILDNPVRTEMVEKREDYLYSGIWDDLPVW